MSYHKPIRLHDSHQNKGLWLAVYSNLLGTNKLFIQMKSLEYVYWGVFSFILSKFELFWIKVELFICKALILHKLMNKDAAWRNYSRTCMMNCIRFKNTINTEKFTINLQRCYSDMTTITNFCNNVYGIPRQENTSQSF